MALADAGAALLREIKHTPVRPIPVSVRDAVETELGCNLDGVRLHVDTPSTGLAASVGARAFSLGRDIVVGAKEPAPHTSEGRWLLAHELTHAAQQQANSSLILRAPAAKVNSTCADRGIPAGYVLDMLRLAQGYALEALYFLHRLQALPEAERRSRWDIPTRADGAGAAHWFGSYDAERFNVIVQWVFELALALRERAITFICPRPARKQKRWGGALPGISRVRLKTLWQVAAKSELESVTDDVDVGGTSDSPSPIPSNDEIVQTIIHEVGHVIGIFMSSIAENKWYGREAASKEAQKNPRRALRSAENFAYFIMEFK